jgi:hypothetical protein
VDIKENSDISARIWKGSRAVLYLSEFLLMSQSLSQLHSAQYIRMCGNVTNSELSAQWYTYLHSLLMSESLSQMHRALSIRVLQIQSHVHSGIFAEFGNVSKSEPNAPCPIYQSVTNSEPNAQWYICRVP